MRLGTKEIRAETELSLQPKSSSRWFTVSGSLGFREVKGLGLGVQGLGCLLTSCTRYGISARLQLRMHWIGLNAFPCDGVSVGVDIGFLQQGQKLLQGFRQFACHTPLNPKPLTHKPYTP